VSGDAPPFVTLRAGRADRDEARLRIVAAIVSSLGAGLYALARPGYVAITVSVATVVASFAWAARVRRSVERSTHQTLLALAPSGLTLTPNAEIAWASVRGVEVDEDRLVVLVHHADADPLVIEPVYDGLSVYDLAALVERCRSFGQSHTR
jgi:hypothetical protein